MNGIAELQIDGRIATAARFRLGPGADGMEPRRRSAAQSAVAFVERGDDIAAVVRFAAENGLRVSGQGTGHGAAAPSSSLEDTILVKTERMRGVEVDSQAR